MTYGMIASVEYKNFYVELWLPPIYHEISEVNGEEFYFELEQTGLYYYKEKPTEFDNDTLSEKKPEYSITEALGCIHSEHQLYYRIFQIKGGKEQLVRSPSKLTTWIDTTPENRYISIHLSLFELWQQIGNQAFVFVASNTYIKE